MKRTTVIGPLTALAALAIPSAAEGASVWASVNLNTTSLGASAGVGLVPVPFVGTLGVEGGVERLHASPAAPVFAGVTLRDINLPLTDTDAFVGLGLEFSNASRTYLEGGLRTSLIGPFGLKASLRSYLQGGVRAGFGAEVRF